MHSHSLNFVTTGFLASAGDDCKQLDQQLFIMKFVQLGTQIKTGCEKRKYTKKYHK